MIITAQTWISVCCSSRLRRMFPNGCHGNSACRSNWQGSTKTFPSPTSNTLPRSGTKSFFLARLPSSARGRTPLHYAAGGGHDVTAERLLAAGADVNAVTNAGRGLGAGRVDAAFTQICRNFCLNSLKLWSDAVGKGR